MINLEFNGNIIKNIDTVLFDKDGTFIDLHFFWGKMTELRASSVIKRFIISSDLFNDICLFLGYDTQKKKMLENGITALYSRAKIIEIFTEKLLSIGVLTSEKEIEEVFNEVNKLFYENMIDYTKPIESAIEFIKKLKTFGVKLGIVTSDSKESTILTLRQFGWENFFDAVIGRESVPFSKESGKPTLKALELLNANPLSTVMIGDAPMDYLSAKNAGIPNCILVATGQIDCEKLSETSEFVVNSLSEISIKHS